jgi:phosphatidylserine decarboxylase
MTQVRERTTGASLQERVFGGKMLPRLYPGGDVPLLRRVLRTRWFCRLYGAFQRSRLSKPRIKTFAQELCIDLEEAEFPLDHYTCLDAFFSRRLRPGTRPADLTPHHLIAPCDGRVLVEPVLGSELVVKRSRVAIDVLLGDPALARRFQGGAAVIIRLAPADYHRFHFVDSGTAGEVRPVPGPLESVHAMALASGARSFENARHVSVFQSDHFGALAIVEVGAMLIGSIVQRPIAGRVSRADEKGHFGFGGSTVVLLAEPGRVRLDDDLVDASREGVESLVRMGTRIGRAAGRDHMEGAKS